MATYELTGAGGTTGHPANGRTPYLVENTIDVSAINSRLWNSKRMMFLTL